MLALAAQAAAAAPVKLIFDTDFGGGTCQDVDDVGTLCMLNALMDNGEAELLAIVVNTMPTICAAATVKALPSTELFALELD